jgi:uncharacterized membrane protein YjdF
MVRNAGQRGPSFLRTNRFVVALASIYGIIWIFLASAPRDRAAWVLENLLVVFFVWALPFSFRRFTFLNRSSVPTGFVPSDE